MCVATWINTPKRVFKMRNKFEERISKSHHIPATATYESHTLPYTITSNYLPDWIDHTTRTIYETKGFWRATDRKKIKAIKEQYPGWRIVMIFYDSTKRITKSSKTTYAQWCDKNGIDWVQA
ncbi:endodeoxyribonuclease [Agrobacterium sp. MAFF310724]|uniref:endodeoxyribonuclease n=1 Tax=Agrobacterium TaxID=357 RepID=UPI0022EC4D2C|nr:MULTISPECIES: endodeoxyribonuclease [Agrobacterium]MDA5241147.1 endodeoxyribonuclease [Agrobacterium sp. MAFF310724]MDA5249562.1 endodeoxyribonuclease [Agrobacterium sp. MAFF210268]